jgi:hypothetical protein
MSLGEYQTILKIVTLGLVGICSIICSNLKVKNNFVVLLLFITFFLLIGVSLSRFYYISAVFEIGFCLCVYFLVMSIKTYDNFIEAWSRNLSLNTLMVVFPCVFIMVNSNSFWTGNRYSDVIYFIGCLSSFALLTIPTTNVQLNSLRSFSASKASILFLLTRNIILFVTFYLANARSFMLISVLLMMPKSKALYFLLLSILIVFSAFFGLQAIMEFANFLQRGSLDLDGGFDIPRVYEIFTIIDTMRFHSYFLGNGFGSLAQNPFYEILPGVAQFYSSFHNAFLEIFFKFGVFGVLIFVSFIVQCLRKCQTNFELLLVAGYVIMSFGHSRFSIEAYDLLIHTLLILLFYRKKHEINDNNRSLKSDRRYS